MEDTDIMPWGKHQGTRMIDVPPDYLIWLYENNKCSGKVKDYIVDNLEVLKMQIKKK